jgi:trk system potassium uptake protein TrkH
VATTLGNTGPGFGAVGPSLSFAHLPEGGKMLLFFCMWIGRLEMIAALVLFVPEFWRR